MALESSASNPGNALRASTRHASVSRAHRRRHVTRGQALVELAVIATLMLTMSFSVLELGRAYYAYVSVTHAVRDGARYGMDKGRTTDQVSARVAEAASPLTLTSISPAKDATKVTVTATYEFTPVAPLVGYLFPGGSLTISRTAVARVNP